MAGLLEPGEPDPDDQRADRQVDQEGQPPGDHGERSAQHQSQHRSETLHRRRHRHRAVAGVPGGIGRGDQRQAGRRRHGGAHTLHRPGRDQQRAIGGQPAGHRGDGEHPDPGDERPFMPDRIADPATEQQQTAEGQYIGGDDPTLAGIGEIKFGLHAGQRDDHDGAVEGGHQLHAGDREDRDPQHAGGKRFGRRIGNADASHG